MGVYTYAAVRIAYQYTECGQLRRSASANPVDAIGGIGGIGSIGYYWPGRYWPSVIGYHRLLAQVSSLPETPWMGSQIPKYEVLLLLSSLIVIGLASCRFVPTDAISQDPGLSQLTYPTYVITNKAPI